MTYCNTMSNARTFKPFEHSSLLSSGSRGAIRRDISSEVVTAGGESSGYGSVQDLDGAEEKLSAIAMSTYGNGVGVAEGESPRAFPTRPRNSDEFGDHMETNDNLSLFRGKLTKTGRQRKKLASRTKGGEFQAKRVKRRVYFCCVSSEIDLEGLQESLKTLYPDDAWEGKMYEDVLHMFMPGRNDATQASVTDVLMSEAGAIAKPSPLVEEHHVQLSGAFMKSVSEYGPGFAPNDAEYKAEVAVRQPYQSASMLFATGAKEVYIFEFGALVFWGFHTVEIDKFLESSRAFSKQGILQKEEFSEGQDDMAFVTSPETTEISIANDVITLPDDSPAKDRLAVSFAIAQSAVLSIFEARVEERVKEYKYIPEALAIHGKVRLSPKRLGAMTGEVYRIRHDVNLHSEILDTPDFFWKEENIVGLYRFTSSYLEMNARSEVLNKRLDMLRELLVVLQQQQENESSVKLEWIVIWLIVVNVVVEACSIAATIIVAEA